jgi:hypothetical protein
MFQSIRTDVARISTTKPSMLTASSNVPQVRASGAGSVHIHTGRPTRPAAPASARGASPIVDGMSLTRASAAIAIARRSTVGGLSRHTNVVITAVRAELTQV